MTPDTITATLYIVGALAAAGIAGPVLAALTRPRWYIVHETQDAPARLTVDGTGRPFIFGRAWTDAGKERARSRANRRLAAAYAGRSPWRAIPLTLAEYRAAVAEARADVEAVTS